MRNHNIYTLQVIISVIIHNIHYLVIAMSDDGKVEERAAVLFGKNRVHTGGVRTRQLIIHCQVISCNTDITAKITITQKCLLYKPKLSNQQNLELLKPEDQYISPFRSRNSTGI